MAVKNLEAGALLCQAGEPLKELYVIGQGTVRAIFPGGELLLHKGDIVGIQDIKAGMHSCTCVAETEVSLVPYPFENFRQLLSFLQQKPNALPLFLTSSARFSTALLECCADFEQRLSAAYAARGAVGELPPETAAPPESEEEEEDVEDLLLPADMPAEDGTEIPRELENALSAILEYAQCDKELADRFTENIETYRRLRDRDSSDDRIRVLRSELTKDFYEIYNDAYETHAEKGTPMPAAVKLFFHFGFVDAGLAGAAISTYLLSIADDWKGDPERGVYTFLEWLDAIYAGEKEPSRNEFDLDFPAFLREQKKKGNITAQQESQMLKSALARVCYELENVFPIVNKMTFGRISTFCPIFSSHNVMKSLPDILMTPKKIRSAIKRIRKIDFSAFYREVTYTNETVDIPREYINIEILPDVILMPNVGVRAAMWQEIEGKRRTTPARFMLSALAMENLDNLLTRIIAEYRWEICKRIQGAHWNNVAEPSLTSEYCDYAQFYRKNRDLSPEAKDKIKLSLQRAKNSMKEMFVQDYAAWINYEGSGSPRLNKIARTILFAYCPFPDELRKKLSQHPLYREMIERYGIRQSQSLHHLSKLIGKLEKQGYEVPKEIITQIDFVKM